MLARCSNRLKKFTHRETTLFTTSSKSTAEITIRRSRFLSYLLPCSSKDEAKAALDQLKREHWDAVHHCYAYRLGEDGQEYRMSDDGEPSGSAGKPILFALQQAELVNVILVVVRYYGGVKLGIGPLARAYAEAGKTVIEQADTVELIPMQKIVVHCMYDDVSRVIALLDEVNATYEQHFSDSVSFDVVLAATDVEFLTTQIVERTGARAGFSKIAP